jgi:hypothetical protein
MNYSTLIIFDSWNFWNLNPVWRRSPWQQLSYAMEFKSNQIIFNKMLNKVLGYLFFLILAFWLSIRSKPSEIQPNDRTFPQNICSISPELVSTSNRLCCLWSSTCDNTLRKSTFPLMCNHRYGLQFNIANSNLHLLLCILLAGDIATNPGPACNSTSLRCLSFNAQSLGSHNSNTSNLKSFQDLENLDVITIKETWLNDKIFDNEILPNRYNIIRKDRPGKKRGGGVLIKQITQI